MTFKQKFILKCLECMEQILAHDEELAEAVHHYTENKVPTSRYQLNTKITDASQWNEQDKLSLSATVFEAIARSSLSFYSESDKRAQEVNAANEAFLDKYLPRMTENTNSNNRIDSVKKNIEQIKTELKNKIENNENPYSFFTPVTAGLVVMAAAATTIALLSYKA
ncbi:MULTISPECIES: hypothetical protein [Legionella]|uniref:Uncharacterized protein n=1 Tax=Legionella resiliens TaxID=2905958 RepID=A0ABS8WZ85_9GAMM|nr:MULTISPECIES: hypothetical protein [unclassified Legionella]MCE0722637.1 hypothetical protein [Legionella sp. 9fVS26]MCE3531790.1 hypothetical protein [Legionella sp. 8cVS16]QLZ67859.1 hypothetical protein FOLKNPGA_00633 [Legionella sp. PC1000]